MFTARKASVEDCGLIREMACVAFPDTYKTILSPEQLDYMMEWMYSPKTSGGRWPKGTYITSPTRTALPAAISLSSPKQTTSTSCKNLHPAPIPGCARGELPLPQGYRTHQTAPPGSCRMELHVNRHNKAVKFYERMGMRKLREGDFEIGGGFYMNDYIMGLEI